MVHQVKSKEELQKKFDEAGNKLVVVDFFATWCGPCKRIAPFLDELAKKHADSLVMLKVDVDEIDELVKEYKIEIMPTFVFKRSGQHIDTLVGSNEEKLETLIKKHLGL